MTCEGEADQVNRRDKLHQVDEDIVGQVEQCSRRSRGRHDADRAGVGENKKK